MASTLGERIRARRQRRGWKLKDLARESGMSVPYLSDLERDQSANPTLETLNTIARALECEPTDLLGDGDTRGADVPLSVSLQRFVNSPSFSKKLQRHAERLDLPLDDEMQKRVTNFLANSPKRSTGELTREDWSQLLDFYMFFSER